MRDFAKAAARRGSAMLFLRTIGHCGDEFEQRDGIYGIGHLAPAVRLGGDRVESRQRI